MLMLSENDKDTQCHAKAKERGQRTFTLVEQDMSSVAVIAEWVKQNILNGSPAAKIHQAVDDAIAFRDSKITKKIPD